MKFAKNLLLLLIPAFIPVIGIVTMEIMVGAPGKRTEGLLSFITIAASTNIVPFLLLFGIHYKRVCAKTGHRDYSFWGAYLLSLLVMVVVIVLLLREVSLGRSGSQLIGVGFIFLPNVTVPIMLVSYIIGWTVEWWIRRRSS